MSTPLKILLVDDEEDIRAIISEFLEEEGHGCTRAADGLEAVEFLKTESFDVLISDFRMPRMDGSQLLKWCRQNNLHLPVIFVTGNAELLPSESFSLQDCCTSIINKPLQMQELATAIDRALERNHQLHCSGPLRQVQDDLGVDKGLE